MLLGSCKSWTESTKSGSLKKGTKPSQCGQKKKKWHWETENLLLTFNVPNLIHLVHYLFFIWAQVLRKPTHYCPGCFLVNSVSISWEIVLSFIMTNKGPEIITLNRKSHKDTSMHRGQWQKYLSKIGDTPTVRACEAVILHPGLVG